MRIWLMAARPRTLPAAIAPVLVGTALAVTEVDLRVGGFVAALLGSIFIQVGTNLSNDYSDARRGADREEDRAREVDEVGAARDRQPEAHVGGDEHLAGRDEAARRDAHRPEALLGVGAAARVGVVVGEVRPDLEEERAEQGGDEPADAQVDLRHRERRADEHGRDGRGQGPRPGGHQPDSHRATSS